MEMRQDEVFATACAMAILIALVVISLWTSSHGHSCKDCKGKRPRQTTCEVPFNVNVDQKKKGGG